MPMNSETAGRGQGPSPSTEALSPANATDGAAAEAPAAGTSAPTQLAQAAPAATGQPIGQVETLEGTVIVTRADGTQAVLQVGDPVFQGDSLETDADGTIGIVFADETVFSMAENARMVLDEMIYDPGTGEGSMAVSAVKGVFTFVSGQIAKADPEAMTVETPLATIGIRGTQGGLDLGDGQTLTVVLMTEFVLLPDGSVTQRVGEMFVTLGGQTYTINQPEFAMSASSITGEVVEPYQMSIADVVNIFSRALGALPTSIGRANDYGVRDEADAADLAEFEVAAGGGEVIGTAGVEIDYFVPDSGPDGGPPAPLVDLLGTGEGEGDGDGGGGGGRDLRDPPQQPGGGGPPAPVFGIGTRAFSGTHDEYTIERSPDDTVTVTDLVPDRDGTTTIADTLIMQFTDVSAVLGGFVAGVSHANAAELYVLNDATGAGIEIAAGTFANTGTLTVEGEAPEADNVLAVTGSARLENTGTVETNNDLHALGSAHVQNEGTMQVDDDVRLFDSSSLDNTSALTLETGDDVEVHDDGVLKNSGAMVVGEDLELFDAGQVVNAASGTIDVGQNTTLVDESILVNAGAIAIGGGGGDAGPDFSDVTERLIVEPTPQAGARFTNPVPGSLDVDDGRLIAGAPAHADGALIKVGAAHVYAFDGDDWALEQTLAHVAHAADPDDARRHLFGRGSDIDGDIAVVGEPEWGVNWNSPFVPGQGDDGFDLTSRQGLVHVYTYDEGSGAWSHTDFLNLWPDTGYTPAVYDGYFEDVFGYDVAVDADAGAAGRIIVGAVGAGPGAWSGQAYVYEGDGAGNWTLAATLTNPDPDFNDFLGAAVDIDGDVAVVGTLSPNTEEGQAYVYGPEGSGWAKAADLHTLIDGIDRFDNNMFGLALAIDGDTIVVGARDDTFATTGKAYVFHNDGSGWDLVDTLTPSDGVAGDRFGTDVAIDGDRIVVTAMNADVGGTASAGKAYVFEFDAGSGGWVETDQIVRSSPSAADAFGSAVALDGEHLAVGAEVDDTTEVNQGAVLAYEAAVDAGGDGGELRVEGEATLANASGGTIDVLGAVAVADSAHLQNDGALSAVEMGVTGEATVANTSDDTLTIAGDLDVSDESTFENTGTLAVGDDFDTEDDAQFTNTGTVTVGDNIDVKGDADWTNADGGTAETRSMRVFGEAQATNAGTLTVTDDGGGTSLRVAEGGTLTNAGVLVTESWFGIRDEDFGGFAIGSATATVENTETGAITAQGIDVRGFARLVNDGTITVEDRGTNDHFDLNVYNDATGGAAEVVNRGVLTIGQDIRMDSFGAAGGSTFTNTGAIAVGVIVEIGSTAFDTVSTFDNLGGGSVTTDILRTRGVAEFASSGTVSVGEDVEVKDESDVFNAGTLSVLGDDINVEGTATFGNTGTTTIADRLSVRQEAHVDNFGAGTLNTYDVWVRDSATMLNAGTMAVGEDIFVNEGAALTNTGTLTIDDSLQVKDDGDGDPVLGTATTTFYNAATGTVSVQDVQIRGHAEVTNDGTLTVEDRGGGVEQADLKLFNTDPSDGVADFVNNGVVTVADQISVNSFGDFGGSTFTNNGAATADGNITIGNEAFAEESLYDNMTGATTQANHINVDGAGRFFNALDAEVTTNEDFSVRDSAVFDNFGLLTTTDEFRVEDSATANNHGTVNALNNVEIQGGTLVNTGAVTAGDNIDVGGEAVWTNAIGGTATAASMRIDDEGLFDNDGTLTIEGPDWLSINESGRFENAGTLTVEAVLAVKDDDDGDFVRGPETPDASLHNEVGGVVNAHEMQVRGFVDVLNDGTITIANPGGDDDLSVFNDPTGGLATFTNTGTIGIGDDLNVDSFGDVGGSTFTNTGSITVGATLGVGVAGLTGTMFTNAAGGDIDADRFNLEGGAAFENAATATLDIAEDTDLRQDGALTNAGTMTVGGIMQLHDSSTATNEGALDVDTDLHVGNGALTNAEGATLTVAGELDVYGTGMLTNAGTLTMENGLGDDVLTNLLELYEGGGVRNEGVFDLGASMSIDGTASVTNAASADGFTVAGDVSIGGGTAPTFVNASVGVDGDPGVSVGGKMAIGVAAIIDNSGTLTVADQIDISETAAVTNSGTMTVTGDIAEDDEFRVAGDATFDNLAGATIEVLGDDFTTRDDAVFTNDGAVQVANFWKIEGNATFANTETGTVTTEYAKVDGDGSTVTNDGLLSVTGAFGDFEIQDGAAVENLAGATIEVLNEDMFLANEGSLSNAAGATIDVGRLLRIEHTATLTNAGAIDVGDDLTFDGDGVTYTVVLDEGGAGTVSVGDVATFDGTLALTLADGYTPGLGDSFGLFAYDSFAGAFDSITGTDLGGGLALDVTFGATAATATVVASGEGMIALGDLDGTDGFRIDGALVGGRVGTAVTLAGDVNGDGFDDVVVAAPYAPVDGSTEGRVYVVFGDGSAFPDVLDVGALNGTNGFVLNGIDNVDLAGFSVGGGDVNGDGLADLVLGARNADSTDNDFPNAGETYVVFGQETWGASLDLSSLGGTDGFPLYGIDDSDMSGWSVDAAGDLNGDGIDDVVIGAFRADAGGDGFPDAGETYVVFGRTDWSPDLPIDLDALGGTDGFVVHGIVAGDESATSVAVAGDVNGDGLDDLIIGAPEATYATGEAYVVYGKESGWSAALELSSLGPADGVRLEGGSGGSGRFGISVGGAGDVNGDGFDDVIVGAFRDDTSTDDNAGAAYVVFGGAALASTIAVDGLDGSGGFKLEGIESLDETGRAVSGVGDVNADGFDDVLVGGRWANPDGTADAGESYLVFGKASGWTAATSLADLDGTDGLRLAGIDADDESGTAVGGGYDINGDGFDDLVVGAPWGQVDGVLNAGESYVVFGGDFTGAVTHMGTDGTDSINAKVGADVIVGGRGGDFLNGNGGADVIRGGEGDDWLTVFDSGFARLDGGTGTDRLVIGGFSFTLDLTTMPDNRIADVEEIEIGGVNDGGVVLDAQDVLNLSSTSNTLTVIGRAGDTVTVGDSWVLEGAAGGFTEYSHGAATLRIDDTIGTVTIDAGPATLSLDDLDGTNGFVLEGVLSRDNAGFDVAGVGDIDGDGFDDVIVGAPHASYGLGETGEAYVVFGGGDPFPAAIALGSLDGSDGFLIDGLTYNYGYVGKAVSGAGDVDGDGLDDLLVTAPRAYSNGYSYVVFGDTGGFGANVDLTALNGADGFSVVGRSSVDYAGRSVSQAGDVNGDGFGDVIVGAPFNDAGHGSGGQSYVVFGSASPGAANVDLDDIDGSNGFTLTGGEGTSSGGEHSGWSVGGGGDVNGDGFADVVVGARFAAPDSYAEGTAYVVFGSKTPAADVTLADLDGTDGFKILGVDNNGRLGVSVSTAGDINGDGFDDLVVGAPYADVGGDTDAGEAYVVFGMASGFANIDVSALDGDNGFRIPGIDLFDDVGWSVDAAGDVNADGLDDLIVGARLANQSYVVFGNDGDWSATLDLAAMPATSGFVIDGVGSGKAVGGAGDVNGDGFDDLIVGSYSADPGGRVDAGEAYVVFGGDFTGAVTHQGDGGDNVLSGTFEADVMVGGAGDDTLTGNGGDDVLRGGAGDDVFVDTTFQRIDGGTGADTLVHDGDLDLGALFTRITGIEAIDITGTDDNTLTLDLAELLAVTDGPNGLLTGEPGNVLVVEGNAGDVVDVDDPTDWTSAGPVDGYTVYTHDEANAAIAVAENVGFT